MTPASDKLRAVQGELQVPIQTPQHLASPGRDVKIHGEPVSERCSIRVCEPGLATCRARGRVLVDDLVLMQVNSQRVRCAVLAGRNPG